MSVKQIAQLVQGTVLGDEAIMINQVNGMAEAQADQLTFARDAAYVRQLADSQAGAALVPRGSGTLSLTTIEVDQPDLAFFLVLRAFADQLKNPPRAGSHPQAVIADDAQIHESASIGPFCVISSGVRIDEGAVLQANIFVGEESHIGAGTHIYPQVVIRENTEIGKNCIIHAGACIGSDGFGFVPMDGIWNKIPQIGTVSIGDDVEIGSNTAIDRATFGVTRIGSGTKIDNLVQIGHNVIIGKHCAVAGMAGFAGSTTLGDQVRVGANVGFSGHITVGDGSTIGARSGVMRNVEPGAVVSGLPAIDHKKQLRVMAAQLRTPEMLRRIAALEKQLEALKEIKDDETKDNS
ncbi:MAG: UDP-3-O-(3-hydroxymyristoyl)glucosamine N-acyltransferase [Candidatus Hydrogenedens sp.]|nr:UDP-3-O-(3-hydroxymyristoyl)glucosamine N-acyltransferase [Candidatus Hydrogenedens sp.]